MTAVESGRRSRFTDVQLMVTSLVFVVIAGCQSPNPAPAPAPPPVKVLPTLASGSDTPIVIMGGSIHFRAASRQASWMPCPSNGTNCYMAPFTNEPALVNYQFVDDAFNQTPVGVTSVTNGWEIDVVDKNPDGKHMVLICASSSGTYTACDHGPITTQNIYVIATGGGTFDPPQGPGNYNDRIVYHDGVKNKFDYIGDIRLNASSPGVGGTDMPCSAAACAVFLSK